MAALILIGIAVLLLLGSATDKGAESDSSHPH